MLTLDRTLVTVRVPVNASRPDRGGAEEVVFEVRELSPELTELRLDSELAGYIKRDGQAYLALAGSDPDDAEICGRFQLSDEAAACLFRRLEGWHA